MATVITLTSMVGGVGIAFALIYLDSLRRLRRVTGKSMRQQLAADLPRFMRPCTHDTACTAHPRPADTYLQSEAERAWYTAHVGPLPQAR